MIIDMHGHLGDLRNPQNMAPIPMTVENLIMRMDGDGIDKAAVLPWPACPEGASFPGLVFPNSDVIGQMRQTASRRDRLIVFGNADPRWGGNSAKTDFSWLFERFLEIGCVGMGEVSANIFFDDPRTVNLFRQCGEWDFPVTIESTGVGEGQYGFVDEVGSPHLERLIQLCPRTTIIGHGPGFWAEISADVTNEGKCGYPKGPIKKEGSVCHLLRDYPNVYADLSANSGHNAVTRDMEFGVRFVNEFQDKLLYGTDVCFHAPKDPIPHLPYLRQLLAEKKLDQKAFDKICSGNALRLMKRYKG